MSATALALEDIARKLERLIARIESSMVPTRTEEILERIESTVRRIESNIVPTTSRAPISPSIQPEITGFLGNMMSFPYQTWWRWDPVIKTNQKIGPGKKVILWDKNYSGWLYLVAFETDNPDLQIILDIRADGEIEFAFSANQLYKNGLTKPVPGFGSVITYDPDNNYYFMVYTPIPPGVPFRGRNAVWLYNPTSNTSTYSIWAWIIVVGW